MTYIEYTVVVWLTSKPISSQKNQNIGSDPIVVFQLDSNGQIQAADTEELVDDEPDGSEALPKIFLPVVASGQ